MRSIPSCDEKGLLLYLGIRFPFGLTSITRRRRRRFRYKDDALDFVRGRDAFQYLNETVFAQFHHSGLLRRLPNARDRRTPNDKLGDRLVHRQQFEQTNPPFVASVPALITARAAVQRDRLVRIFRIKAKARKFRGRYFIGLFAILADASA